MPVGLEVTVPGPVAVTVSASWSRTNAAPTERACDIETTHAPVPLHAPLQPVKCEPAWGVDASVTEVPKSKPKLQVPVGQERPAGVDATVPWPVPESVTWSACGLTEPVPVSATAPEPPGVPVTVRVAAR